VKTARTAVAVRAGRSSTCLLAEKINGLMRALEPGRLAGHCTVGAVVSHTRTRAAQRVVLPAGSVAVSSNSVLPSGNTLPEGQGEVTATVPPESSLVLTE
jgi:hypothetical protein